MILILEHNADEPNTENLSSNLIAKYHIQGTLSSSKLDLLKIKCIHPKLGHFTPRSVNFEHMRVNEADSISTGSHRQKLFLVFSSSFMYLPLAFHKFKDNIFIEQNCLVVQTIWKWVDASDLSWVDVHHIHSIETVDYTQAEGAVGDNSPDTIDFCALCNFDDALASIWLPMQYKERSSFVGEDQLLPFVYELGVSGNDLSFWIQKILWEEGSFIWVVVYCEVIGDYGEEEVCCFLVHETDQLDAFLIREALPGRSAC